jgi:hypothetical protein
VVHTQVQRPRLSDGRLHLGRPWPRRSPRCSCSWRLVLWPLVAGGTVESGLGPDHAASKVAVGPRSPDPEIASSGGQPYGVASGLFNRPTTSFGLHPQSECRPSRAGAAAAVRGARAAASDPSGTPPRQDRGCIDLPTECTAGPEATCAATFSAVAVRTSTEYNRGNAAVRNPLMSIRTRMILAFAGNRAAGLGTRICAVLHDDAPYFLEQTRGHLMHLASTMAAALDGKCCAR